MHKIKEKDIRPPRYYPGLRKAVKEDLGRLVAFKKEFTKTVCPACGSRRHKHVFIKFGLYFHSCLSCETVFMNPRATAEVLDKIYSESKVYDYWNKFIFPASEEARKEKIVKPRVKRILEIAEKYGIRKNCLVEIGAGFGTFCETVKASRKFKKVIAVEPVFSLASTCRSKGIETIDKAVEKVKKITPAPDVVVSFEVIEHLFSPLDFLKNCRRIMSRNSIIAVTCPNYKGFDISVLGVKSDSIDAEHVNLFNPKALTILFQRAGFKVLECFTPGELDADIVRNKVLSREFDISRLPFLKEVLLNREEDLRNSFQEFLKANRLSSHMWLVAKKL